MKIIRKVNYIGPVAEVYALPQEDVICTSAQWDQDNREDVVHTPANWF